MLGKLEAGRGVDTYHGFNSNLPSVDIPAFLPFHEARGSLRVGLSHRYLEPGLICTVHTGVSPAPCNCQGADFTFRYLQRLLVGTSSSRLEYSSGRKRNTTMCGMQCGHQRVNRVLDRVWGSIRRHMTMTTRSPRRSWKLSPWWYWGEGEYSYCIHA